MYRIQLATLFAVVACAPPSPPQPLPANDPPGEAHAADRAELLRLHERARTAHLQHRADWLVAEFADSLISVSRGGVSVVRPEQARAGFQRYFDAATFQAWDDILPPRIRISGDGQMAFVVVEKRVHLTTQTPGEAPEAERTRFAWLSVYEKQAGRWRLAAIASTERPDTL